ncbi:MAG: aminopeptidase [Oscillospiraceae bacterium]|nr:aminopeptidase [Oscillospiraceae bacterium]
MDKKKSEAELLKEKLTLKRKHAGLIMSDKDIAKCDKYCKRYMDFLSVSKIEREAVFNTVKEAETKGFVPFDRKAKYKAGDKVYYVNRGKAVIFAVIGKKKVAEGINIMAAHIDSPRLDLKQNPLYENEEHAYFKTHYYGGIKKYQWGTIPLALHGAIVKADGTVINVNIGEDENDPVFCVTDLLPHLAQEQMKRTPAELLKGEELNVLIGSRPFKDDDVSEKVKLAILSILNDKYGITEADLVSAELDAVPAGKARDVGLDRSMIGAYGHDDKVCSYTAFSALIDMKGIPERTALVILTDKEETGSDGNTGLKSAYLRYFISDLAEMFGEKGRHVLSKSRCLSADVNAGFDPGFPDVLEKRNAAIMSHGVCVTKFTGARGKSGTSDASAEFVAEVRRLLDDNDVIWQTGELGRVDLGGGGTVAAYIANLDVDTIDVGVPVLCMHAPFELVSKFDVYQTYKAFEAFCKS